jgi:hypothetical protein
MALFGPAWQACVQCQQKRCPRLPHSMPSVTASCAALGAIGGVIVASAGAVAAFITNALLSTSPTIRGLIAIAKLGFAYLRITSL